MTKPIEALIARQGNTVTGNYYLAKCDICEEMFTSERMTGGEPIADTGDYGDCYCPYCSADDSEIADYGSEEAVETWNFQQKHIDALISALERSQKESEQWRLEALSNLNSASRYKSQLEASQLAVKLPEQYPDDGELSFCIDLYDEPDADLRLAMWLKELRRRRAGGTVQEAVKLPPSFDYEHDDLVAVIPVMEAGKVKAALRAAGITVQGDEYMGKEKSVKFNVQLLKSDDCVTLMAHGAVSKSELIDEAIRQEEIDESEREGFERGEFCPHVWLKAVPREGYSTYYYDSHEGVRGAFKATCIQIL